MGPVVAQQRAHQLPSSGIATYAAQFALCTPASAAKLEIRERNLGRLQDLVRLGLLEKHQHEHRDVAPHRRIRTPEELEEELLGAFFFLPPSRETR